MKKLLLSILFFAPFNLLAKEPAILVDSNGNKYIDVYFSRAIGGSDSYNGAHNVVKDTIRVSLNKSGDDILFSKIAQFDGYSADDLYFKVKLAASDFWKNLDDASVLDDDKNRVLICRALTTWADNPDAAMYFVTKVRFTTKIECRDNRLRISMYGFTQILSNNYGSIERDFADVFKYGVKKNGYERNGIGKNFRAWTEVANKTEAALLSLIRSNGANNETDNW